MDEPASVTALLLLARALYLGSGMVLVNAAAFRWLILVPAPKPEPGHASLWRIRERLRATFLVAAGLLAIATILWFWAVAAEMSGTSLRDALDRTTWTTILFQTRFGLVCQVRLALFALLAALLAARTWNFCRPGRWPERLAAAAEVPTSLIAAALLASVAWTGHAGAAAGGAFPWTLIADSVHLLAGAIWPAGLLFFGWILSSGVARENPMPLPVIAALARRFAVVSLAAVVALALTGSVETWLIVRSIDALVTTSYGRLLCLKLAVFAAMLALATWNRFRLLPQLDPPENGTDPAPTALTLIQLRRFVRIELGLAAGIIAIVALLGTLAPPH